MGPIIPINEISQELNFLIAFVIGIGFGFALEQAGFSSSRKLAGMFYGYDTTVLKVFFTAALVGLIGLGLLNHFEMIDMSIVYINEYYMNSAIIGGVIMGIGFIVGGFCPGTSVCAAAIGKIDAMAYLGGSLIGIFIFGETYPLWKDLYIKNYLGDIKLSTALGLSDGLMVFLVIIAAVVMFWVGEWAEKKFNRPDITKEI
ncbi:YeeE/YedE thiosulfate transporter family protein [Reichenbachiella ulvae]|uniref:YeeE/YedE thiosulfate transporter family protein n=1 Tax=Reichenbachiella ulvae TaxID=2980104 RepID=A0ABT3D0T4_9BACT|nr:YeeE/YedE thiosulfate transporter family protein [Reichenbachiella ulvae]MCV9389423.1 YeeE/YedE thiosulfate transporter family protein [Reichenbachiella ulvae]